MKTIDLSIAIANSDRSYPLADGLVDIKGANPPFLFGDAQEVMPRAPASCISRRTSISSRLLRTQPFPPCSQQSPSTRVPARAHSFHAFAASVLAPALRFSPPTLVGHARRSLRSFKPDRAQGLR